MGVALATLAVGPALAATPERNMDWDALISEAKKHGGEETRYKTSVSYVFHDSRGWYVTLTRMLDSPTRAVCTISDDQNVTVCGNWDTGKLRYGWRADDHSPWTYSDAPPSGETGDILSSLPSLFFALMDTSTKWKIVRVRPWN